MPYRQHIDVESNLVLSVHFGEYHPNQAIEQLNRMLEHPDYRSGMSILRDIRQTQLPDYLDYKWFIEKSPARYKDLDRRIGRCRLAWVVGNVTDNGKIHRWCAIKRLAHSIERQPFREIDKALEWLNITRSEESDRFLDEMSETVLE